MVWMIGSKNPTKDDKALHDSDQCRSIVPHTSGLESELRYRAGRKYGACETTLP